MCQQYSVHIAITTSNSFMLYSFTIKNGKYIIHDKSHQLFPMSPILHALNCLIFIQYPLPISTQPSPHPLPHTHTHTTHKYRFMIRWVRFYTSNIFFRLIQTMSAKTLIWTCFEMLTQVPCLITELRIRLIWLFCQRLVIVGFISSWAALARDTANSNPAISLPCHGLSTIEPCLNWNH